MQLQSKEAANLELHVITVGTANEITGLSGISPVLYELVLPWLLLSFVPLFALRQWLLPSTVLLSALLLRLLPSIVPLFALLLWLPPSTVLLVALLLWLLLPIALLCCCGVPWCSTWGLLSLLGS